MQFSRLKVNFLIIFLMIVGCSSSTTDPVTGEKVVINPDPKQRAREYADKKGGIFGDINNRGSNNTTFAFGTSNVLWRATLKTLEFLPIANADYSGGIIVYDWYSDKDSNEQIKISIKFLSNEVRSDAIQITSHKRMCINDKCSTSKLDNNFSNEIKDSILTTARALKIEDSKKENK
jgi:hypothetical protein